MFDTVLPADTVEFCPHPTFHDLLACGTYKLEETEDGSPQRRIGQCLVLKVALLEEIPTCTPIQWIDLAAILDMKWCHLGESAQPTLAIGDAEGNITLCTIKEESGLLSVVETIDCASPSQALCLSLDWSNRISQRGSSNSLIVSLSDGDLSLLQLSDSGLIPNRRWHAHDHEPWATAWDYWNGNVLYSGGDDLTLKVWDVRQLSPIFVNRKYGAGVTSIQSNPHSEYLIAVGSYDSTIQVFDSRRPLVPLSQSDVGGGVWRIKWHPVERRKHDILAACMHDGFKVLRYSNDYTQAVTVKRFDSHTSLAYGVDWSFRPESNNGSLVASCSFYDHMLHLWHA